jgi:hypothetical protein
MMNVACLSRLLPLCAAVCASAGSAIVTSGTIACGSPNCDIGCDGTDLHLLVVNAQCGTTQPQLSFLDGNGQLAIVSSDRCEWLEKQGYSCTHHVYLSPEYDYLTLGVVLPGSAQASKQIFMPEYVHCSCSMAYLTVNCDEQDVEFTDVQYLSPCDGKPGMSTYGLHTCS